MDDNESLLRQSQRVARLGHYVLDIHGDRWTGSEMLDEIFGLDPDDVRTLESWEALVHPECRQPMLDYFREEVVGRRREFDREYRIVHRKTGEVLWVHGLGSLEFGADGAPVRMFGTIQDVTKRKTVELALAESEERLQTVFDGVSDGLVVAELSGRRFVLANKAFCELTGYSLDEVLVLGVDQLHPPESLPYVVTWFERQARGEVVVAPDIPVRRKDGSVVTCDVGSAPLVVSGRRCLMGSFRDNTYHKRAEEEREKLRAQLVQAQKMESVGRLAGGVAHDFNNMLGVILGYTDLLLDQIPEDDPKHATVVGIRSATQRSAELTRQLLAFARKQAVMPKVLDLNATVAGSLKMLRRLIGEDIDLAWQPGVGTWPVKIDPSQVDQALANLCVNARDAIAGVGKVTIETANRTLSAEDATTVPGGAEPGDYVMLAIGDTGCGMTRDVLAHLFEPFFTTKGVGQGTGLGLAMLYGIVQQNGGFITVTSEPDRGTTFRLYLPRHRGKSIQPPEPGAANVPPAKSATVLLVEDEPMLLEMGRHMLQSLGYRVLTAGTPSEALRLADLRAREIALLVTDVVMPEMNGIELAARLVALIPGLKRLFMSGYTANVFARDGLLDEGVHFLQKPFSRHELAAAVKGALEDA